MVKYLLLKIILKLRYSKNYF